MRTDKLLPGKANPGLFARLADRILALARHRHAEPILAGLTFAESSFFPLPPETMLLPMAVARPERAWRYATLVTAASVLGGVAGYLIGMYGGHIVMPLLEQTGYGARLQNVFDWFDRWGFWIVLVAGFSPIPYKLFTIGAGMAGIAFVPFILASLVGRGSRFFLECGAIALLGPALAPAINRHLERIGWASVVVLVIAVVAATGLGQI